MPEGKSGLAARVLRGDVQAAARLISLIEDQIPEAADEMEALYRHTGKAHIVGITGSPGAGKSALTDCLIGYFRSREKTIGVIAVDPSSALTGGAVLGDRIRMQRHAADPGVFIRSLATRGCMGGLTRAAVDAVRVLDAMGKDIIFLETVGSGQVEADIARAGDTTVLVLNPGAGDDVQAMKAGILEIADIMVVNKADREGAGQLKAILEAMLAMKTRKTGEWSPPVVLTEATADKGTDTLSKAIIEHRQHLVECNELPARRRQRIRQELLGNIEAGLKDILERIDGPYLDKLAEDLLNGRAGFRRSVKQIKSRLISELSKEQE